MSWDTPIAVVGMACRFPGADDVARYWDNILHDVYSIGEMPPERFNHDRYYDPEIGAYGKSYCSLGGLVSEHPFDARAFRLTPKTVASTDQAHLWALEVARAALEDGGYDPFELSGRNVGVVVGHARGSMMTSDMAFGTAVEGMVQALEHSPSLQALGMERLADLQQDIVRRIHDRYPKRTEDGAVGSMTSALAGIVSNAFGLTGRHMVVDAACASSFAALEIGARALQQGKLDAALVGGASYSQELSVVMFAQSRALSPNGSFPFDRRADGFISSDGFGLFLLRRLEDAVRDGNRIRAVIRGVGGSCDGKGRALWAPRREGQVLAMQRAYAEGGVDPGSVDLIEGHATSTPLGDRTEVEALHEVFAEARGGRPIHVGSIKGNIGHAREAAGAAGLTKAILALEHATLPPTGNFRQPSEEIPWRDVAVEVVTSPRPWSTDGLRRAGANAFGIGGLNYHVIVEEAPPERRVFTAGTPAPQLESTSAALERCDIAIVGVGGRFAESESAEELFDHLLADDELSRVVPDSRWSADIYHQAGDRAPYRTYLTRGGFVSGFVPDWRRYKMPPKLVDRNDPLQFMLLESAMDALEGAGLDPKAMNRERVAVVMGTVFGSDYALDLSLAIRALELAEDVLDALGRPGDEALLQDVLTALRSTLPSINEDSSGSFSSSTLASRIAKNLDFMGPAYAVDAACASSLASVEAACELLRDGVVDHAVAGGGDRAMRVQRYEAYCQFYALTRGGQPRPFDERADGFLPGEGAGVVVLQRLEDAQREGRPILAILRGLGASGDGERKSLYKPSAGGLARAMQRALSQTELDRGEVGFIECHGGATALGDAAEVRAIRDAYGNRPMTLGAIKSSIGHTQGAAGVASLIKATLALHRQVLPPTRGFEIPHPDHGFGDDLRVNRSAEPLLPSAAAVSSMGLAGINYHAVLERPRDPEIETIMTPSEIETPIAIVPTQVPGPSLVRVSAASLDALRTMLGTLGGRDVFTRRSVGSGPAVASIAAVDAEDVNRALTLLTKVGLGPETRELREKQGIFIRDRASRGADRIAFLFSGQGSQYAGMMIEFLDGSPSARSVMDRIDAWCTGQALPAISGRLRSKMPLSRTVFGVQSMILAADLVAHAALTDAGIEPDVLTGHSYGDYSALVAAGAWSVEDALTATRLRCNAIEEAEVNGGMTAVTASAEDVQPILTDADAPVYLANRNAPDQVVLAGSRRGLTKVEAKLSQAGLTYQRLEVPGPFHSRLMSEARDLLEAGLANVALSAPRVPFLSSVSGKFETDPETIRASLVAQLLEPVDFVAQVRRLEAEGVSVFIECGPRAVLAGLARRITGDADVVVLSTDDKARPGAWALSRVAAALDCRRAAGDAEEAPALAAQIAVGTSHLSILEGSDAEALLSEPGFDEFWSRTRPGVTALVEQLWDQERRRSQVPEPKPALATTPPLASTRPISSAPPPASAPPVASTEPVATPRPISSAPPPASAPPRGSAPPVASTGPVAPPRPISSAPPVASTTPPAPMLKAVPPPKQEADAPPSAPSGPRGPRPARGEVQAFLLDAMCEESGYPPDIIEMDADLEADLGIDTVKQAQVFGRVRDKYGLMADEKLALRDFPTLQHVLDYVDQQLDQAPSKPATPSRIEVLDLTARRTAGSTSAPPPPRRSSQGPSRPAATPRSPSHPSQGTAAREAEDDAEPEPTGPPEAPPAADPAAAQTISVNEDGLFDLPEPQARLPKGGPIPVTVLHLEGTARQIGQQHGEALRDPILEVMHRYQDFIGPRGMSLIALPEMTLHLRRLFDADSLQELQGLAEAVGVPYLYLLAYNLDAALFPAFAPGCTQALHLASANAGQLLHIVNEDSPLLLHLQGLCPRVVQVRTRRDAPIPERRVVMFSMAGQIAGPNGVTDDGLTITGTTLLDAPPPPSMPDGLPHPQLVKQMLEGARTLEEARELVLGAHRAGRWSVLISDADQDRGHYLEYDSDEILTDHPVVDRVSTTNHANAGPAPDCEAPEHSQLRHDRACVLLGDGAPLTAGRAQSILRDRHDLGRGRDVAHPTMNTVRRVDNVMSLVVEPARRRLHVSDRVVPPGLAADESVGFITIDYGRDAPDPRDDVMRRYVVRARTAPRTSPSSTPWRLRHVLLVGTSDRARALAAHFQGQGASVVTARDAEDAKGVLAEHPEIDGLGLVLSPPQAPKISELRPDAATEGAAAWVLHAAAWSERREALLAAPFQLLRAWGSRGPVFAITALGGGLGFENAVQAAGEQGGLLGALKAMRRELDIRAVVLDTSPSERPEAIAEALGAELEAGAPRLEVGLLRGKRVVLAMAERPLEEAPWTDPPATWLVTGGARGITAKMALRLAQISQPTLHLFGRMRLPADSTLAQWRGLDPDGLERMKLELLAKMKAEPAFSPVAWKARCEAIDKALEVDANLRAIRDAGSLVVYHAVDLADREALAEALSHARALGPLQGILHGAGFELAKPLAKKTDELFEATVQGKVDGLVNLLHLTAEDPIGYVVGFSSVSGRFGGHGQVDYALANEAMAHVLHEHRARHLERKVSVISWAAFSEVGLAARSSARAFLERTGQAFMPPTEGADHLIRELAAGLPEPEVTICERLEALDLDHLLVPEVERAAWRALAADIERQPMLGPLVVHEDAHTVIERHLGADEPFLADHRMGATPILPAVIGLEMFFELARTVRGDAATSDEAHGDLHLARVQIHAPLKVPEGASVIIRGQLEQDDLRLTATPRRRDGVTLEPDRAHFSGTVARHQPELPAPWPPPAYDEARAVPYPYPDAPDRTPGSRAIYHGPTFRTLQGVLPTEDGGIARLSVPPPGAPFGATKATPWLPVAVLDGCLQAAGLLSRLKFGVIALPAGFRDVVVRPAHAPAPGDAVIAHVEHLRRQDDVVTSRLTLYGRDGAWVTVARYEAQAVPNPDAGLAARAQGHPTGRAS